MTEADVAARLRLMHDRADQILALLETNPFTAIAAQRTQDMSRGLQIELRDEYNRLRSVGVSPIESIAEFGCYKSAIEEAALSSFGALPTSSPACTEWYEAIEEARVAMEYHLHQVDLGRHLA
jgi:hypothetical protein